MGNQNIDVFTFSKIQLKSYTKAGSTQIKLSVPFFPWYKVEYANTAKKGVPYMIAIYARAGSSWDYCLWDDV